MSTSASPTVGQKRHFEQHQQQCYHYSYQQQHHQQHHQHQQYQAQPQTHYPCGPQHHQHDFRSVKRRYVGDVGDVRCIDPHQTQAQLQPQHYFKPSAPVSILRKRALCTITGTPSSLSSSAPPSLEVSDDEDVSQSSAGSSQCPSLTEAPSCDSQETQEEDKEQQQSPASSEAAPAGSSPSRSGKLIHFYNKVRVFRIPNRQEYPEWMKRTMWGSLQEIHRNARRNTIEFAADGWDWRLATEDDAFVQNEQTGQAEHPVHRRTRKHQRHLRSATR